jgi:hypothetical protein
VISGWRGSGPDRSRGCHRYGSAGVSATSGRARLAGECTEIPRALPRPAQGPLLGIRDALSGGQEAHQEAPQEAGPDGKGRLTGPAGP